MLHPALFPTHSSAPASVTRSDEEGVKAFPGLSLNPVNVTMERWPFKIVYVPSNLLFHRHDKFQPSQHLNVDFVFTCVMLNTRANRCQGFISLELPHFHANTYFVSFSSEE